MSQATKEADDTVEVLPATAETPKRRADLIVSDPIPILDTARFEHMGRVATAMARASLIPDALVGETPDATHANCFLVVNQAVRWSMDPFALAQHSYSVRGKLGYEGKVIAAAINSDPRINGRLKYEYENEGKDRRVTVTGTFADTGETETIDGTVGDWATDNGNWNKSPDQMLAYRGAREWARRHMPDRLLGVYSDDEIDTMINRGDLREVDGVHVPVEAPMRDAYKPAAITSEPSNEDDKRDTEEVEDADATESENETDLSSAEETTEREEEGDSEPSYSLDQIEEFFDAAVNDISAAQSEETLEEIVNELGAREEWPHLNVGQHQSIEATARMVKKRLNKPAEQKKTRKR